MLCNGRCLSELPRESGNLVPQCSVLPEDRVRSSRRDTQWPIVRKEARCERNHCILPNWGMDQTAHEIDLQPRMFARLYERLRSTRLPNITPFGSDRYQMVTILLEEFPSRRRSGLRVASSFQTRTNGCSRAAAHTRCVGITSSLRGLPHTRSSQGTHSAIQ